jgi:hypothetical protein
VCRELVGWKFKQASGAFAVRAGFVLRLLRGGVANEPEPPSLSGVDEHEHPAALRAGHRRLPTR